MKKGFRIDRLSPSPACRWSLTAAGMLWLAFSASNLYATLPECQAPAPLYHPLMVDSGIHVDTCSALPDQEYPPTAGRHYPIWAKFQTYVQPVSPGYWLHSAEHGAVILLYNCPKGCPEELAALNALAASLPEDTVCTNYPTYQTKRRLIIAPDNRIDSAFYAIAWGWSLGANCLDTAGIHAFYTAHYAQAPEDECYPGTDLSATHWCHEPILEIRKDGFDPGAGSMPRQPRPGLLWEGSLAARVDLSLEIFALDGRLLESLSLGSFGPGPVQAVWHPEAFRNRHPSVHKALCRLSGKGLGSGPQVLMEKGLMP